MRNSSSAEERDTFLQLIRRGAGWKEARERGASGSEHRVVAISVMEINEIIGAASTGKEEREKKKKMSVHPAL